jgi:hypothetical protein
LAAFVAGVGLLALPVASEHATAAAPPETLWDACTQGSGAGQCSIPRGIAAEAATGRLYIADQDNRRIVELTAWGEFVRAFGWGVDDGGAELQTCTAASGCQASPAGTGAGQFGSLGPQGLALDSAGNLYAVDFSNRRVQKFDPTAGPGEDEVEVLLSFGEPGTGNGQFGTWRIGSFIDVGPGDKVYVGDQERVQVFSSVGAHLENLALPGETVQSLAVDVGGSVYVALCNPATNCNVNQSDQTKPFVQKLNPAGVEVCKATVDDPRALALDPGGNLYVASGTKDIGGVEMELKLFTSACAEVPGTAFSDGFNRSTGIATNVVTEAGGVALYVSNSSAGSSVVRAYDPPPDKTGFDLPPSVPPTISAQYGVSADTTSATVRAQINPHFWEPPFEGTTYYVEYGTAPCSEGGCATKPAPPGNPLDAGTVNVPVNTTGILLDGLAPETTYFFRFVAKSGGGGPVFGIDPDGEGPEEASEEDGLESTFTTFPVPGKPISCPANEVFRYGAGAQLPDCRAYELVSPADKNGGDIETLEGLPLFGLGPNFVNIFFRSRLYQAAPAGEAITYSASRAFAGAVSAPWSSQYLGERAASGWSTESLNHPLGQLNLVGQRNQETPFRSFSEDLCSMWLIQDSDLTLSEGAPEGVPNLYRRENCEPGKGKHELLTTEYPPGYGIETEPEGVEYVPEPQGHTPDGCSIFRANAALTPDANPTKGLYQLYESCPATGLRLLSVLPSGSAASVHSSLGTAMSRPAGNFRDDSLMGAVAADGQRIFWTADSTGGNGVGPQRGTIHLRANPTAPQSVSGACDEAGKACSLVISAADSFFWAASPAGTRVIYQTGGQLFEAEIEEAGGAISKVSTPIAGGVAGVVGTSEDATVVFFTSSEALDGGSAGQPNLYRYEQGSGAQLVATLAAEDSDPTQGISPESFKASFRTSRVSPDGEHLLFMSQAPLTGYNSADVDSGTPAYEVFLYDAGKGELRCLSCNPSGIRPDARAIARRGTEGKVLVYAAAQIPGWSYQLHPSRTLSEDGSRVFFESFDALVLADTNGVRDVYEWEQAESKVECEALGAMLYVADAGGCLSLISSGDSPNDSEFVDASADGSDVFFTTTDNLVLDDSEAIDLYDARVGGGFPPKVNPPDCQGEGCQPQVPPPPVGATPGSSTYTGPGNVPKPKPPKKCPKGKHKVKKGGKVRCVKNAKKGGKSKGGKASKTGGRSR